MIERKPRHDAEGRPIFKMYSPVVEPHSSGTAIVDFIICDAGHMAVFEWTADMRPAVMAPIDPAQLTAIDDAKATHVYSGLPVVHPALRV